MIISRLLRYLLGEDEKLRYIMSFTSLVILDQLSKLWIIKKFQPGEGFYIIDKIISITYVQNKGAAFGIMQGKQWFFIGAAILVIALISYYNLHYKPNKYMQYLSGLIAGGAVGNLIDRMLYNSVVDFISVGWWPVFNIADIGIVCGSIGLFIYLLFIDGGDKIGEN